MGGEFKGFDNFTPNFATGKRRETEAALTGGALIAEMRRETQLGL